MTEAEWNASSCPIPMLQFLHGKSRERKLRLFACACARRIWPLFKDDRTREAVEQAERHAAGSGIDRRELAVLWENLSVLGINDYGKLAGRVTVHPWAATAARKAAENARLASGSRAWELSYQRQQTSVPVCEQQRQAAWDQEWQAQADLLREIFGNPFRPRPAVSDWLLWNEGTAVQLALASYAARELPRGVLENVRLAVLADALEDAGCSDVVILEHLRGPGPHVLGCWCVDLLLEKD